MTEAEWLSCDDAIAMVNFIRERVSYRKGNLFLCAMCRHHWHLLFDTSSQECVEVVEQHVDGNATEKELDYARWCAECPTFGHEFEPETWNQVGVTRQTLEKLIQLRAFTQADIEKGITNENGFIGDPAVRSRLLSAASLAYRTGSANPLREPGLVEHLRHLNGAGASYLQDVFGPLPFRPVTIDPAWLRWHHATIPQLAQVIYDERELPSGHLQAGKLAILADALIEAGCTNEDILSHCRSPGPHVRGCWVVDLLLAKA